MFTPYFIAECIAFIFTLLLLAKGVDEKMRIFTLYCFLVLINESACYLLVNHWHRNSNHQLENFAILLFFVFYLYSCYRVVSSFFKKRLILWLMLLFTVTWIINMIVYNTTGKFYTYSLIAGCIVTAIAALLYMLELLNDLEVVHPLKQPFFYIACSYLLYGIPLAIIFSLHEYFAYIKTSVENYRYFFAITLNVANVLMYILLSISFIISWNQRKLSK
jgi:hypothetical protein